MGERYFHCLHSAHREACHSAVLAVRFDSVIALDEGNDALYHILCKRRNLVGYGNGAVGHNHNHGSNLAFCQQVVKNPACGAHARPRGVVVSAAVNQVENGQLGI